MSGQAVRFIIVGIVNTAVDLGAFALLGMIPGMPSVAAKTISYVLGIGDSFLWNKLWTFNAWRSEQAKREFALFFLVNMPPLAVNVIVFTILGLWIDSGSLWVRLAKAFAAAIVSVIWNFMGSRYLAFRHSALSHRSDARSAEPQLQETAMEETRDA